MKIAKTVAKKRCTKMIHLRRDTFLKVQMKRVIIRTIIIEIGVKSVDWVWDFAGLEP
ncbi:hypothetical protein HanPSC8_Chr05g0212371 [Helianthus annuus]|nr:hypothetical protein HanPSC8_Chr05g0212371 [Helianthus annuus]